MIARKVGDSGNGGYKINSEVRANTVRPHEPIPTQRPTTSLASFL
ncbi:hypothetical protein [Acetobacterium wieringae]|nr:hypothetical protein [Acetobacterium wieringae]MEA4806239.1 hypothetical protein [Acetobacterium wieringae]